MMAPLPETSPQPAIILVRPQLGENIGKAARAMLNFGLTDLRLVTPRDGWPNPDAGPAAAGADVVLAQARVYASTTDAVADCSHVYATTVRRRGVTKPVVTPEAAARDIIALSLQSKPAQSGILFGPERAGLEAEDVALARSILTIPINPEFGSLNLAQAVILVAYEWSRHQVLASPPAIPIEPAALHADLEGMIGHFERLLEDANFFFPPARARVTRNNVRTMLTKPGWSAQEVRMMRGILTAIEKGNRG
jgi:tRNA/rRNA methyltransferase